MNIADVSITAAPLNYLKEIFSRLLCLIVFISACFNTVQAQSTPTQDVGWLRQIVKEGSMLIYYQPQIDDWKDYKDLTCKMAFSLTSKGGRQVLGVAGMEANTITDKDAHTVFIRDVKVNDVRFPSLSQDSVSLISDLFRKLGNFKHNVSRISSEATSVAEEGFAEEDFIGDLLTINKQKNFL